LNLLKPLSEMDERKGSVYEKDIKISDSLRYAFILCHRTGIWWKR